MEDGLDGKCVMVSRFCVRVIHEEEACESAIAD